MWKIAIDPERREIGALTELAPEIAGGRVLEIGCGEGRLTWRYAARAARVLAIEPDRVRLARALEGAERRLHAHVELEPTPFEALDPARGPFDVVLFSWAL